MGRRRSSGYPKPDQMCLLTTSQLLWENENSRLAGCISRSLYTVPCWALSSSSQTVIMDLEIPSGLTDLLQDFTVHVLRDKPEDIVDFAANYFMKLKLKEKRNKDGKKTRKGSRGVSFRSEENEDEGEESDDEEPGTTVSCESIWNSLNCWQFSPEDESSWCCQDREHVFDSPFGSDTDSHLMKPNAYLYLYRSRKNWEKLSILCVWFDLKWTRKALTFTPPPLTFPW